MYVCVINRRMNIVQIDVRLKINYTAYTVAIVDYRKDTMQDQKHIRKEFKAPRQIIDILENNTKYRSQRPMLYSAICIISKYFSAIFRQTGKHYMQ